MRNTWMRVAAAGTVLAMAVILVLAVATGRPTAEIVTYAVILAALAGSTGLAISKSRMK